MPRPQHPPADFVAFVQFLSQTPSLKSFVMNDLGIPVPTYVLWTYPTAVRALYHYFNP